jgi:hypothetical protein
MCSCTHILVTCIIDGDDLVSLANDNSPSGGVGDSSDELTLEGQILNPLGGVR